MLKVYIIEDELPAQINLTKALKKNFPDIYIAGVSDSVTGSVSWLKENQKNIDIIFMDVSLSDGKCFDIFDRINITPKVIITTAYDNYAIKAFKVNCIDYLLKPITDNELKNAVNRACELIKEGRESMNSDIRSLREDFMEFVNRNYKKRFVIKIGNRFEIINTGEIAYFYSEEKTTHLMTVNNEKYALDSPLNIIAEVVDPSKFFQISRSLIVSVNAITSVSKLGSSGKLSVKVKPEYEGDAICSRMRSSDFLHWLDDMS